MNLPSGYPIWLVVVCIVISAIGPKVIDLIATGLRTATKKKTKTEQKLDEINSEIIKLSDQVSVVEKKVNDQEKNALRVQLMMMFESYPNKSSDIFYLAKKYFIDNNGNSYVKGLFEDWAKKNDEELPDWYIEIFGK